MNQLLHRWFFFNDHKDEHVSSLDGLRGIAVLLVMLSHATLEDLFFFDTTAFLGIGKGGVFLFYALSAYLLDKQITQALRKNEAHKSFWIRYFIRRFLRIYPMFIIALFIFWGVSSLGIKTQISNSKEFFQHLFLLDGRGVFWSIPVEFKYYFLSPLLLLVCHHMLRWDLKKIALMLIVLSALAMLLGSLIHLPKISTLRHLMIFLTGTFIAIFDVVKGKPGWMNVIGKMTGIICVVVLSILLFMNLNIMHDWLGITTNAGRKGLIIYSSLAAVLLMAALWDKSFFRKFLEWKVFRFTGIISFSLYLLHMPVIFLMTSGWWDVPEKLRVFVYFAATFLVSTITFLLIEKPVSRIRINTSKKQTISAVPD